MIPAVIIGIEVGRVLDKGSLGRGYEGDGARGVRFPEGDNSRYWLRA